MLALTLVFFSCGRDRVQWDGEVFTSIDNSFAESEFSAISNLIDTEARADTTILGKTSGTDGLYCPQANVSVTVTGTNTARLTVDFSSGVNCLDGRLRTGKLHADFTGKWKDAGSTATITPENYTVNGYAFTFTKTITMNDRVNGNLNWTVDVDDAVLTHPDNGQISWQSIRTTTWAEGEGDLDPSTNVYIIEGDASGIARNGLAFTANTDQPLRVELSCQYIVQGVLSLTPDGRETRSIDYGTGACDNQAVLTVGNFQGNITLP